MIVSVLLVLSGMICIFKFGSVSNSSGAVIDNYLILSKASDAFEINSLRNISLFE